MTTYVNPYTGQTIDPSQVGYESITLSQNTFLQWPINGTSGTGVVANIMEVTATANNLLLVLPSALQVSVGQAFIVRNVGTSGNYSFSVTDSLSNVIVNIPVSSSGTNSNTYYVYLTNNTTSQGTWSSVAMGIGTSSAVAGTLAGYGLTAINNTLNESTPLSKFSASYQFQASDRASLYVWTGGAGTGTLPAVSAVSPGWFVIVKNDGTGILTMSASGSSWIDSSTTASVQVQIASSSVFVTDGTNWYSYGLAQNNVFNYTQLLLNVTGLGSTYNLTSAQAKNVIQEYIGTLSQNLLITVPPTVQLYSFQNKTSGSFTLTFGVYGSSGTTVVVPANTAILAISDGVNVYNSNSATSSFVQALTLGNGSVTAPSLSFQSDTSTGLYLPATGQFGIAVSGVLGVNVSTSGMVVPVGINAGAF
jgi:hypothetical protein